MTNMSLLPHRNTNGLVKLSGRITAYSCRRERASFVFTKSDQTKMGIIAVTAAIAGLGGQAVLTAANATSIEEEADYVQFSLNGQPVKGWVWRSPFKCNDEVEVVAEWQGDHFEIFGISRPNDRTIALYPHCSRGRWGHARNALKWGAISNIGFLLLFVGLGQAVTKNQGMQKLAEVGFLHWFVIAICMFFLLVTCTLAIKWLPYVKLAENVFRTLEWPNPVGVDLIKTSRAQRTEKDPGEFGTFYFRY